MTYSCLQKPGFPALRQTLTFLYQISTLFFRPDRANRIGREVAIYVKDDIHRQNIDIVYLEALLIELPVNKRIVPLGGVYLPPYSNNNHWLLLEQGID